MSGPLLDRIDLHVTVPRLSETERGPLLLRERPSSPDSVSIRQQVIACREWQLTRSGQINARLEHRKIKQYCVLSARDAKLLNEAIKRLHISARATLRILKIARTIADLDLSECIATPHVLEAINYRRFDAP